ncbi:hypothetical protein [Klebsiella oxytoca]|uniref:Uncharacterized protein n=1 Tax=Klebsiella oxytoca TaxID=571 RepID=A0A6B8MKT4_KLEOX|nr:hypothetical protein [Klebsiella oxytoca]QGN38205.1 hypothetical protein GJ746_13240 [Klebsiella oxytoca]
MQTEREVSPLVLIGLKFMERKLDKYFRGRAFVYLPAMRLQSECCCHLTRKYIVIGVSPPAENIFLKRHISLDDSLETIIKKLNFYRSSRQQDTCEFCHFIQGLKTDDQRVFDALSESNNYRIAARQLNIQEKRLRRKVYTFTQKMSIPNRRWFLWWITYMSRSHPNFFHVSAD